MLHASKIDKGEGVKFPPQDKTDLNISCSFEVPKNSLKGKFIHDKRKTTSVISESMSPITWLQ